MIPHALTRPHVREFHGITFVDNYEWLRDKEAQETLDYLAAENEYTAAKLASQELLREEIFNEIKARVVETDMSIPSRSRTHWHYVRTQEGKSYASYYRLKAAEGDFEPPQAEGAIEGEELVFDANAYAEGKEFFSLGSLNFNRGEEILAYATDTTGDERYTLRLRDMATGEDLDDVISDIAPGVVWTAPDTFLYTRYDASWRPYQVYSHTLGAKEDTLIFTEEDPRFVVGVGRTRSRRYVMLESVSKLSSEFWVLDLEDPEAGFQLASPREEGLEYSLSHAIIGGEDTWVIHHNRRGENFGIDTAPATLPIDWSATKELVPAHPAIRCEGVSVYRDFIAIQSSVEGMGRLAIAELNDAGLGELREVPPAQELSTVYASGDGLWETPYLRIGTQSFTTPAVASDLEVATGEIIERKRQEILGDYNPADYRAWRMWATAPDGTKVPMSVIERADIDASRPQPALLYGYGSYESSIGPGLSIPLLSVLDRGMRVVYAHVRGGGEMGRSWYHQGAQLNKMNTFTDFIACADALIDASLTTPQQLVAKGGSAGGLLMGAVANLAPEKFCAIDADVPFVDPLTSILMPELPLTSVEWEEWGNPIESEEVYRYMASYSPYENVRATTYPTILATTSFNDTRVLYVEPAKWIAKLRATATGGAFLLKTEMNAGHGGVSGRYEAWRETAFSLAFDLSLGRTDV